MALHSLRDAFLSPTSAWSAGRGRKQSKSRLSSPTCFCLSVCLLLFTYPHPYLEPAAQDRTAQWMHGKRAAKLKGQRRRCRWCRSTRAPRDGREDGGDLEAVAPPLPVCSCLMCTYVKNNLGIDDCRFSFFLSLLKKKRIFFSSPRQRLVETVINIDQDFVDRAENLVLSSISKRF